MIELCIVIAVLMIIVTVGSSALNSLNQRARTDSAATAIASELKAAQQLARAGRTTVEFSVNGLNNTYQVLVGGSAHAEHQLPIGVTVDTDQGHPVQIEFSPTGQTDSTIVQVHCGRWTRRITIDSSGVATIRPRGE